MAKSKETKAPAGKKKAKGSGKKKKAKKGLQYEAIKRDKPPRLVTKYKEEVIPALMKEFGYKNVMQVPRLSKMTVNMGLGEAIQNPKLIESSVAEMGTITGQRPVVTKARRSIASFKLREGMKVGVTVTLRREKMYEFFDRMVNLAIPRVRDFKGLPPKAFDGRGNYTLGLREQIVFPEIDYDKIEKIKGLNVTIVTTAKTDEEGHALLKHLGMPFRK
ncbi:MAG: 50S ribosomal protein L5 [Deltaproteobacteria bacterium]|nr:50S ribosomal protein L5 [Deltaproteobacteria bacterium]